jgi:two-component system NarL family sensor kinase
MNPKILKSTAWSLVVVYGALTTIGLTMQFRANTSYTDLGIPVLVLMLPAVSIWPIVGAVIISSNPRHPVGWLLNLTFMAASFDMFFSGYISYDDHVYAGVLPARNIALVWLNWSAFPFAICAFTLIILLFPDGSLPSPRWRPVAWGAVGAMLFLLAVLALKPGPVDIFSDILYENPTAINRDTWSTLEPVLWIAYFLPVLFYLPAFISLLHRMRQAQEEVRRQIRWLVIPAGLYGATTSVPILALLTADRQLMDLGAVLNLPAVAGIVVATGFAIFRYRLYNIDGILTRTLVYATLTALVIGLYMLVVGALGMLFQRQGSPMIALIATGMVAVLFQPLNQRLQRTVNRLIYGDWDDPVEALSNLGSQLEAAIPPDVVSLTLVETIARSLKLPYVAIQLSTARDFEIAAEHGEPSSDTVQFPLMYQGINIGHLVVAFQSRSRQFSSAELQLLRNVAHQAGAAIHTAQLTRDLQMSRKRLVTAREEERRRLRRDLHDGLGATLAALNLEAAVLKRSIRSDPSKAETLVDDFRQDIRSAIDDIRRLVHDLRPPTLDQLGLAETLRALAAQCSGAGANSESKLQITVECPGDLPGLPAAVEVAAYRIVQEALTNVVHHAAAHNSVVRLVVDNELLLEIVDDGIGVANANHRYGGLGLLSMRERAEELGGVCFIEPVSGGGTRVAASLPLLEV